MVIKYAGQILASTEAWVPMADIKKNNQASSVCTALNENIHGQ